MWITLSILINVLGSAVGEGYNTYPQGTPRTPSTNLWISSRGACAIG